MYGFGSYDMYRSVAFLSVVGALAVAFLIPYLLYLAAMQKALSRCSPGNRGLDPGLVWLNLIPMLSFIWNFIVVLKVSESLDAEVRSRNLSGVESMPGRGVGLAFCILSLFSWVPYVGFIPGTAALICWVVFWVQVSGVSGKLG